jgi:Pyruvate/2-oxoacid:ferredoxin oxidoreductase delta subunit
MSYTITNQCIRCDRCRPLCPTGAIQRQDDRLWIDASRCDGCQGAYSVAQCRAVCPTNGGCEPVARVAAAPGAPTPDYWQRWFARYDYLAFTLKQAQQSDYWRRWFDTYSQTIADLG